MTKKPKYNGLQNGSGRIKGALVGDTGFHPVERIALIALWILFFVVSAVIMWKVKGAEFIAEILIMTAFIVAVVAWLVVFIPKDTVISVELSPDKLEDRVEIFHLPSHLKPDWQFKGNVPPFKNATDGTAVYFAEHIDHEARVIRMCHNLRFNSVNYMTAKRVFLELRQENARLTDLAVSQAFTQEHEVMRRVGLVLEEMEYRLRLDPQSFQHHFNYGQNRGITEGGDKTPFSLMGGDYLDDTDDGERIRGLADKHKTDLSEARTTKPIPTFGGGEHEKQ